MLGWNLCHGVLTRVLEHACDRPGELCARGGEVASIGLAAITRLSDLSGTVRLVSDLSGLRLDILDIAVP